MRCRRFLGWIFSCCRLRLFTSSILTLIVAYNFLVPQGTLINSILLLKLHFITTLLLLKLQFISVKLNKLFSMLYSHVTLLMLRVVDVFAKTTVQQSARMLVAEIPGDIQVMILSSIKL